MSVDDKSTMVVGENEFLQPQTRQKPVYTPSNLCTHAADHDTDASPMKFVFSLTQEVHPNPDHPTKLRHGEIAYCLHDPWRTLRIKLGRSFARDLIKLSSRYRFPRLAADSSHEQTVQMFCIFRHPAWVRSCIAGCRGSGIARSTFAGVPISVFYHDPRASIRGFNQNFSVPDTRL